MPRPRYFVHPSADWPIIGRAGAGRKGRPALNCRRGACYPEGAAPGDQERRTLKGQTPIDHSSIITIERHISEEQTFHPEATGTLTNILYDLALAGKVIASKTNPGPGWPRSWAARRTSTVQGETVMSSTASPTSRFQRLDRPHGRLARPRPRRRTPSSCPFPDKYPMGSISSL